MPQQQILILLVRRTKNFKLAFNYIAILLETLTHTTSKIAYCLSTTFEFNFTSRALKKYILYSMGFNVFQILWIRTYYSFGVLFF